VQELHDLPINHRISVVEGELTSRTEPFKQVGARVSSSADSAEGPEPLPTEVETWLLSPVAAPEFSLADLSGQLRTLSTTRGKPVLLNFWTTKSADCQTDLNTFEKNFPRWSAQGLQLLAINVDNFTNDRKDTVPNDGNFPQLRAKQFSFPMLLGSEDVAAVYNIVYRQLFDRHRDLSLPTSFLIDRDGMIV
jgi:peroxiredoxin